MRLAWAVVAGALVAVALTWWLGRETAPGAAPERSDEAGTTPAPPDRVLYRWRDEAGTVQITEAPPAGRAYTVIDVAALERRNTIDPNPAIEAAH